MAPSRIEKNTLGSTICTEFQKPTCRPLHSRPVQALDQATTQGSTVGSRGRAKMELSRTSSMVLNEVTSITYSGIRKKAAADSKKA